MRSASGMRAIFKPAVKGDAMSGTSDTPDAEEIFSEMVAVGTGGAGIETGLAAAKAALDRVRAKGWEVVFLGANFDNISDASSVGVAAGKQMAMSAGTMNMSMERLAKKSRAYGASAPGAAPIEFDKEDREIAQESKFKK